MCPAGAETPGFQPDGVSLRLDDQLSFALYAAARALNARYRPLLDILGLTYPQYLVMLVLWEQPAPSVKELGARLHLDSGTLSPLLKRLGASGLVRRERRSDDERSVRLTLTGEGRALRKRAATVAPEMDRALGLTPEQAFEMRALLQLLTAHSTAH